MEQSLRKQRKNRSKSEVVWKVVWPTLRRLYWRCQIRNGRQALRSWLICHFLLRFVRNCFLCSLRNWIIFFIFVCMFLTTKVRENPRLQLRAVNDDMFWPPADTLLITALFCDSFVALMRSPRRTSVVTADLCHKIPSRKQSLLLYFS